MAAVIGWCGPLIDLARAPSHIDDFVQLLVFVRSVQTVQKDNAVNGRTSQKTIIQVGDETRSYLSVSLWQKHMGSMIFAGDVILLQNIKIVKFRNIVEATTVQISSLLVLVHFSELTTSKGIDELLVHCKLGKTAREKLRRVINWVQHTESTFRYVKQSESCQKKGEPIKNWKAYEEKKSKDCSSIPEALRITNSCTANLYACIGEILLLAKGRPNEVGNVQLLTSTRLLMIAKNNIVDNLISTGCKLCGSTMDPRYVLEQNKFPLYCNKSSKYLHDISPIYNPFLLYVWDQAGQIPLLVKNRAAENLFGHITAECVYKSYQEASDNHNLDPEHNKERQHNNPVMQMAGSGGRNKPNLYHIWLILLTILLQQGKNSPFHFEIAVDMEKDLNSGRFELVSFTMPCCEADTVSS